jgi:hypothetical protein
MSIHISTTAALWILIGYIIIDRVLAITFWATGQTIQFTGGLVLWSFITGTFMVFTFLDAIKAIS